MKLCKYITLLLIFINCSAFTFGQYEYPGNEPTDETKLKKRSLDSRIFFGGNIGLAFASQTAYVELSPLVGYKITPRLWAGGGPQYMYEKFAYLERHIYGVKTFASIALLDNINETTDLAIKSLFLYIENELLSITPLNEDSPPNYFFEKRNWYNLVLAGGGMRFPLGDRMGLSLMVLWGLTPSTELIYNNPEIRLSVDF